MSRELRNSLLDAAMNVRYWRAKCNHYSRYDTLSRIFLAVTSSSTVISWGLAAKWPFAWKGLSSVSAILAIVLAKVDLPKKVAHMSALVVRWKQSEIDYQLLWENDRSLSSAQSKARYKTVKQKEVSLVNDEQHLPYDRKLLERCYAEVCQANGLKEVSRNG